MDMIGLALKGMGFDPDVLLKQATALGAAFENITRTQALILDRLAVQQASLDMITAALGLYVPPPSAEIIALIDIESARFTKGNIVAVDHSRQPS